MYSKPMSYFCLYISEIICFVMNINSRIFLLGSSHIGGLPTVEHHFLDGNESLFLDSRLRVINHFQDVILDLKIFEGPRME
jgi:hypothetical protein